jgi:hypothetical protein
MWAQEQRADVRHHAVMTARTALGQWWQAELGPSWWEILADPGTRADALWQAAGAMVLAIEPIMEQAGSDHGRCGELQRERDFFAGQAEALRDQLERLLAERRDTAAAISVVDTGEREREPFALSTSQAPAWSAGHVFGEAAH